MAADQNLIEVLVGRETLANLLNLSAGRIAALTAEGVLHQTSRGKWKMIDAVHAYVALIKEERSNKTATASTIRVRDARSAEIEIRIARANRDVVDLSEALSSIDDCTGVFLQTLTSIPARITREQNERRRIEAICDEERARVADRFLQSASALRTGSPIAETDPEVDS
jgi:restriction endonuclease Mrr